MTLPIKNIPQDVHEIIRKEQLRLELEEDSKLKIEQVACNIIRQWGITKKKPIKTA